MLTRSRLGMLCLYFQNYITVIAFGYCQNFVYAQYVTISCEQIDGI